LLSHILAFETTKVHRIGIKMLFWSVTFGCQWKTKEEVHQYHFLLQLLIVWTKMFDNGGSHFQH